MKNLIIKITSLIENRIRWKLHWCGYMVGVSAIKDIYVENQDSTKAEGYLNRYLRVTTVSNIKATK